MGYIDDNLMSGESVIYRTQLHWIVFLPPIIWLIVPIAIAIIFIVCWLCGYVLSYDYAVSALGSPFFILLSISIISGINACISFTTSEFGITNKRLIIKKGLIHGSSLELLLTKVESIQIDQGILGRALDFGTITVTGAGGSHEPFHKISSPFEFRKKSQEQIASMQEAKS